MHHQPIWNRMCRVSVELEETTKMQTVFYLSDLLIYRWLEVIICCWNEYISNKKRCRRKVLMKAFAAVASEVTLRHRCCDICAQKCNCNICTMNDIPVAVEE